MRLHCSALKVHLTHCAMSASCQRIGLVFSKDGNPGIAIYQPRRGVK